MNGSTSVCEDGIDTWGLGDLVLSGQSEPEAAYKAIENVAVMFEDADESVPTAQGAKQVYRVIRAQPGLDGRSYVRVFRAESWPFTCAADANTTVSSGSLLLPMQPEVDANAWRGVFGLQHRHRELYSQRVELNLGALPRWKPRIIITRRILDTDGE